MFSQDNTCPDLLFGTHAGDDFRYGALTLCGRPFQTVLLSPPAMMVRWADPRSLAATEGIST